MSTPQPIRRLALPAVLTGALALTVVVLVGPQTDARAQQQDTDSAVTVGVYDQQALFDQYPGSDELIQYYQDVQQQMQAAQQSGDQQKLQQLQQSIQQKRQEILTNFQQAVDEAVPEVARSVGVKVVAMEVIYTAEDVQTTNLTRSLADAIAEE